MSLEFHDLWEILAGHFIPRLESSEGLRFFSTHRAKFEGWMKVEICSVLSRFSENIIPEKGYVDIVVEDWAIELKAFSTNYKWEGVPKKARPITDNIDGVLADIRNLKQNSNHPCKAVSFIAFPLPANQREWLFHIDKVRGELLELRETEFHFKGGVRGLFCLGLVES